MTFNAYGVLAVSYMVNDLDVSRSVALTGIVIASALGVALVPVYGKLSDRVGRKPVYVVGTVLTAVLAFPVFALINTGEPLLIWVAIAVGLGIVYMAVYAPLAAFWAELFDTRVRYTGVGSVYQFSGIFASGLTPLIGAALIEANGGEPWYFVLYMIAAAVVSLVCVYLLPETYQREIMPTGSTSTPEHAQ